MEVYLNYAMAEAQIDEMLELWRTDPVVVLNPWHQRVLDDGRVIEDAAGDARHAVPGMVCDYQGLLASNGNRTFSMVGSDRIVRWLIGGTLFSGGPQDCPTRHLHDLSAFYALKSRS